MVPVTVLTASSDTEVEVEDDICVIHTTQAVISSCTVCLRVFCPQCMDEKSPCEDGRHYNVTRGQYSAVTLYLSDVIW